MKTFKEFLSEAKQIKIGDKVKSKNTFASTNNVSGKVVDIKTVKFASGDQTRYVVQEPDGYKIELRADDIIKESIEVNEAHEVEVAVRDARKANDIAKDMFRGAYQNDGSNVFVFKKEDDADEFKYELENQNIEILEESLNEAQNQQANFQKALKARDAEIEIVRATHPLAKGKYSIKVYAPSVDKSVVFYADVTQFRGDYMG